MSGKSVVEKCWKRVLERRVAGECCRKVLERIVGGKCLREVSLGVGWAGKHRELPNNYLVKISKKIVK